MPRLNKEGGWQCSRCLFGAHIMKVFSVVVRHEDKDCTHHIRHKNCNSCDHYTPDNEVGCFLYEVTKEDVRKKIVMHINRRKDNCPGWIMKDNYYAYNT